MHRKGPQHGDVENVSKFRDKCYVDVKPEELVHHHPWSIVCGPESRVNSVEEIDPLHPYLTKPHIVVKGSYEQNEPNYNYTLLRISACGKSLAKKRSNKS